jgi:glycosyltransferase involved in cell wall biosynthesis
LIDSLAVRGAEVMAVNIANSLSNYGVDSFLCATKSEGDLKSKLNKNVDYLFLNRKRRFDLKAILKLKKFSTHNKIDIIHAHSSSYLIATFVKLLYPRIKIIWHNHYGNIDKLSGLMFLVLKLSSIIFHASISVSHLLEKWVVSKLKVKRAYYLPNFASLVSTNDITKLKGNEGFRIVCLARISPEKDHLNLLKAFQINNKKYPNWSLHIVGNHDSDVYFDSIKLFIKENNLTKKVFFYHNCIDVKNILSQATIGVLSSKYEGLPITLLEYGLSKLAVVITDVGQCKKVVLNSNYGFIVPKEDEVLLSDKMELLMNNKDLRNNMSVNFNKHILNNYSEEKIINRLIKIYNS